MNITNQPIIQPINNNTFENSPTGSNVVNVFDNTELSDFVVENLDSNSSSVL
jgi:hypothetical protein